MFNITYMGKLLQAVTAGIIGLAHCGKTPLFPRWTCWLAIFAGLSFMPITIDPFFKTGPLSCSGPINFWAWFATYFAWVVTMSFYMAADVRRRRKAMPMMAVFEAVMPRANAARRLT